MHDYVGSELAIVGFAGRFPGAPDVETFWRNLRDGVESIRFFDPAQLRAEGVDPSLLSNPHFVPASPVLDDAGAFDARFFGFSPREAAVMDPQHRVFLECAYHALEHAGYDPGHVPGAAGVFAGVGPNMYYVHNLLRNRQVMDAMGEFLVRHTSNDKDFFATRLSYLLDLRGPSVNVQTACSTSLVAVHQAGQSLLSRECDVALAGGSTILTHTPKGYVYREGEILSPDGHCRAFDAKAAGTIFGSGAGVVVLKRFEDALADGNTVYAVVRGSAVNNDGAQKAGYMAPSVEGQAAAVSEAIAVSGVAPDTISYVEAHGTGTRVGDPIEVAALTQAFRTGTSKRQFCGIGSVKTNIGHLDHAAGVSSLIKTILALYHKALPPTIHFTSPNPEMQIEATPFYVNASLQPWTPPSGVPRRAGVNSLGIGGTNAHLILEEAPVHPVAPPRRPAHVVVVSGASPEALADATDRVAAFLDAHAEPTHAEPTHADQTPSDAAPSDSGTRGAFADVAHTLLAGRAAFPYRRAVAARTPQAAAAALRSDDAPTASDATATDRPVAMMFSGQGAQYAGMGRGLYAEEPVFRDAVDACAARFEPALGIDLRTLLFPDAGDAEAVDAANERLAQTDVTQPALFTIQVATARLWEAWGIVPAALIGHSIGEYAAAHVAGVLSLDDACRLVAARGRWMHAMEPGTMLSVAASETDLQPYLADAPDVSISVVNHPSMLVVGGPDAAVQALAARLEADDVPCRPLRTSHAFHSAMMDPALAPFRADVERATLRPPQIPIVSTLTGTWLTDADATDPAYWVRHVRQPVRFADAVGVLLDETDAALVEVGPGRTLVTLATRHPACSADRTVVPSLRAPGEEADDVVTLHRALATLWTAGVPVDADALYAGDGRRRVSVPRYPFQWTHYWVDPDPETTAPDRAGVVRSSDVGDWFYVPSWTRTATPTLPDAPPASPTDAAGDATWLVFDDASGRTDAVVRRALRAYAPDPDAAPLRLVQPTTGDLGALTTAPALRSAPGPGDVEIRVHAAALQFKDVLLALGVYADDPVPMGAECAGTVVRVGDGVTSFAVGDAVIAAGFDSFRTHVVRDARTVVRKPDALSFADAVTLPSGFLTAYHAMVREANLQPGERVFIQSATGGVGQAAVQIARWIGAEVFATAGSEARRDLLREAGISHVYDSRSLDIADAVRADSGGGVDVVIGAFTGAFVDQALSMLGPNGRHLELGKTDLYTPETLPDVPHRDSIRYAVIDMDVERETRTDAFGTLFREIVDHVEAGRFEPLPRHVFDWTAASDAFRLMSQTKHVGKVVLSLAPEPPRVVRVTPGDAFEASADAFTVRPDSSADAEALLDAVGADAVRRILHGWLVDDLDAPDAEARGFRHLFHLSKALERAAVAHTLPITVLSTGMQRVGMETDLTPEKALALGPVRVVPHELPQLRLRSVDVAGAAPGTWVEARQTDALAAEVGRTGDAVVAYRGTDRWVQGVAPAPMERDAPAAPRRGHTLQPGGVYLVTGGTGGLGLELADQLTRDATPADGLTLVLASRSGLPPRDAWADVLRTRPDADRTARALRTVLGLESRGVAVHVPAVDVTDRDAMQAMVADVTRRFGPIRGALHAAGVVDDALVPMKSADSAARVLAPKVEGTRVLDAVLAEQPLDFLTLFSSVSAATGLPGQVDYTAANAFLDAFAQKKRMVDGRPVTAVGWGAWQEVGMAANLAGGEPASEHEAASVHPMFDRVTRPESGIESDPESDPDFGTDSSADSGPDSGAGAETQSGAVFEGTWTPQRFWVLNGHRNAAGDAVLPGTGTLDLVGAAGRHVTRADAVTLRDVYFLSPLELTGGAPRRVRLTVQADGAFTLQSQRDGGPITVWTEHATGVVAATPPASDAASGAQRTLDVDAIRDRCGTVRTFGPTDRTEQERALRFGPEWRCLQEVRYGDGEAMATLALPAVFDGERDAYALHPALLDLATGFGLPLVDGYDGADFYVPSAYGVFRMHRPLPRRLVSHMRVRDAAARDRVTFDVVLADASGSVVAEAEGFQMTRVPASALSAPGEAPVDRVAPMRDPLAFDPSLGLRPEEGRRAFDRIGAIPDAQVLVSPVDLPAWLARIDAATAPPDAPDASAGAADAEARDAADAPDDGVPFAAPRDAVETTLAGLWGDLIGVGRVGLHTDFFDAGGHSLIAVRMFAQLRKTYGVDLPLSVLLQSPTLAAFAEVVREAAGLEPLDPPADPDADLDVNAKASDENASSENFPSETLLPENLPDASAFDASAVDGNTVEESAFDARTFGSESAASHRESAEAARPAEPDPFASDDGGALGDGAAPVEGEDVPRTAVRTASSRRGPRSSWSPLVPIRASGSRAPFFCVHGAGGNVLNFRDLALRIGDDQPVYGLQARGLDGTTPPHETLEAMAEAYLTAIREVQPDGPYRLGGYSAGGVVAFEMAHRLREAGDDVALLALLDTFCPTLPDSPDRSASEKIADHWSGLRERGLSYGQRYARQRLAHEQFRLRKIKAHMYEQMGRSVPIELRDVRMIEAYHDATDRYTLVPYDGRLVLFTAADKGPAFDHVGHDMGWAPYVTGSLVIHRIPGTHDDVMDEPNVSVLVDRLRDELDAVRNA